MAVVWRDKPGTFSLFSSYGAPRRPVSDDPRYAADLAVLGLVPTRPPDAVAPSA